MGQTLSCSRQNEIDELQDQIHKQNAIIIAQQRRIELLSYRHDCISCVDEVQTGGAHELHDVTSPLADEITESRIMGDYDYIVFSGGGVKGTAFCGALKVLEDQEIICCKGSHIKGYAGTSAGSIIAALMAVGYNSKEMTRVMMDLDMRKLVDDKWGVVRDTYNLFDDFGVAPGTYFNELLGDLIEAKTGDRDYTIDELYKKTGIKLVIVGTDLTERRPIYFYPEHRENGYKDIPIRFAVRMSMSIPYIFEPVQFNGSYCVDGGLLDDFALHVFDGSYPGDPNASKNLCPPNPKVLGVKILSLSEVNYLNPIKQTIDDILTFSTSFLDLFFASQERKILTPLNWKRTIMIMTADQPLSDFNVSATKKKEFLKNGRDAAEAFFDESSSSSSSSTSSTTTS